MSHQSSWLVKAISTILPTYRRKGLWWTHENQETIQFVELQKSRFSDSYYINFGCHLEVSGVRPKAHEWHLSIRAESMLRDKEELLVELNRVLTLDSGLSEDVRIIALNRVMLEAILPVLTRCSSLAKVFEAIDFGLIPLSVLTVNVKQKRAAFLASST